MKCSLPSRSTRYNGLPLLCRFIREERDDEGGGWEVRLARQYYSKLFREYCIADLSRYKVKSRRSSAELLLA